MDPVTIEMRPLYEQARREGKWLYCHYQNLWFAPDQLEAEQRAGRFRWGAVNWQVRDPMERVAVAERRLKAAQVEYDDVRLEVERGLALS